MEENFELFINTVDASFVDFVRTLHKNLSAQGCSFQLKTAKSGYVASYLLPGTKRTLSNYVSRKSGMKIRMYLEHIGDYQELLTDLPDKMKEEIAKASVCKRLLDPADCNPKCKMGYQFVMDSAAYQKCRNMAFMPSLSGENNPHIQTLLEREIACC